MAICNVSWGTSVISEEKGACTFPLAPMLPWTNTKDLHRGTVGGKEEVKLPKGRKKVGVSRGKGPSYERQRQYGSQQA